MVVLMHVLRALLQNMHQYNLHPLGEASRMGKEEVKHIREAEQAFKRWADPREIAETVFFLASDAASFMTGSDLLVDCGWVAK